MKNSSVNSAGLRGQVAGETELCTVGQSGTGLTYRGYEITDLAENAEFEDCLLYTSPSPRDRTRSRMPSSA